MKKIALILVAVITSVASASALTLREAYATIEGLPDQEGVVSGNSVGFVDRWIGYIPFATADIAYKVHEVGQEQTAFYGSKIEEIVAQLGTDSLILSAEDAQNIFCFYAHPADKYYSEVLIIIDQAYQGKTTAVIGKMNNRMVECLKNGKVEFTADHKIVVTAPIMVCD